MISDLCWTLENSQRPSANNLPKFVKDDIIQKCLLLISALKYKLQCTLLLEMNSIDQFDLVLYNDE